MGNIDHFYKTTYLILYNINNIDIDIELQKYLLYKTNLVCNNLVCNEKNNEKKISGHLRFGHVNSISFYDNKKIKKIISKFVIENISDIILDYADNVSLPFSFDDIFYFMNKPKSENITIIKINTYECSNPYEGGEDDIIEQLFKNYYINKYNGDKLLVIEEDICHPDGGESIDKSFDIIYKNICILKTSASFCMYINHLDDDFNILNLNIYDLTMNIIIGNNPNFLYKLVDDLYVLDIKPNKKISIVMDKINKLKNNINYLDNKPKKEIIFDFNEIVVIKDLKYLNTIEIENHMLELFYLYKTRRTPTICKFILSDDEVSDESESD